MVERKGIKTEEEIELEKAIFGDQETFQAELKRLDLDGEDSVDEEDQADGSDSDSDLFFIDKGDNSGDNSSNSSDSDAASESESETDEPGCVWHDDDEVDVDHTRSNRTKKLRNTQQEQKITSRDYEQRLRSHFSRLYKRPKWATAGRGEAGDDMDQDEEMDSDADMDLDQSPISTNPLKDLLSKSTTYVSVEKTKLLPPATIDIQKLSDVTKQIKSQSVVQSVCFHPSQPLVLTSGYDKTLRIYQIDGKNNLVASSLYIQNSPFTNAQFHPDKRRVFAAGKRKYLFIWNLETGAVEKVIRLYGHEKTQLTFEKFVISADGRFLAIQGIGGYVNILSADTAQWIAAAKIEGDVADLVWVGQYLTIASKRGNVYEYDADGKQFISNYYDPSLVGVSKLAQCNRWLAVGMESGVVAVYDLSAARNSNSLDSAPAGQVLLKPRATIDNLVTSISTLRFSPDAQILLIASRIQRDALKLVHVPSFSVFKNWPTSITPLGHVSCAEFSPQNQYLVAGNEGGSVRLWALNHYT